MADDSDRVERPTGNAVERRLVARDAESLGERGRVAPVPVEELDHAGRLAERADPLLDSRRVDRVEDPDPVLRTERVRATREPLVLEPAEAPVGLVAEPHAVVRTSPLARTTPSSQRASTSPPWNCWA